MGDPFMDSAVRLAGATLDHVRLLQAEAVDSPDAEAVRGIAAASLAAALSVIAADAFADRPALYAWALGCSVAAIAQAERDE
jgi:hypothetical protein